MCRYKKHAGIESYPPLQLMFATKAKNKGKLDSHCWYFDAFCYLIQPEYCVLFDAGESPFSGTLCILIPADSLLSWVVVACQQNEEWVFNRE